MIDELSENEQFKAQMEKMKQYIIKIYEEMIANEEEENDEGN